MRPFSLLIKPVSADCNLRCEYCFYLEKARLYPETKRHRMSDEILEKIIKTYLSTPQPVHTFGWQGGEPTLMGLDFFRKVTALQEKYGQSGTIVANGLQTNATLIDDAFAEHLARYRFLLGCSLDGPPETHDCYRLTTADKPTHSAVLKGINTLSRYGVAFNVLVLVTQANVRNARQVYDFLTHNGFYHHQYIPCVEFDEDGRVHSFSINGEEWGNFLCCLFDTWYPKDINRVSIRHFDSILNKMVDGGANVCTLARNCCQYLLVEFNGDIYPCDFFVEKSLKIGNVMDTSWADALCAPVYKEFGAQKSRWNEECRKCDCLSLCSGDCLKHRIYSGQSPRNLSWLCTGWRRFIHHTRDRFQELAENSVARQRKYKNKMQAIPSKDNRVGRNEACPCGSGRKYKRCCGR